MLPFDAQRYPTSYFIDGEFRTNEKVVSDGRRLYTSFARVFSPLFHSRFIPYRVDTFFFPGLLKEQTHTTFIPTLTDCISVGNTNSADLLYLVNEASSFALHLSIIRKTQGYQSVPDPIMDKWRKRLERSISLQLELPRGKTVMGVFSPNGSLTQFPPSYGPGRDRGMIDSIARNTIQETHSLFKLVHTLIEEDRLEPVATK